MKDDMAAKHFTPKNISGKRIEDFDFGEFISRKYPEKYYQRSPFLADREFYRTYTNHDEKCYNRTPNDIPFPKQENNSMFSRSNSEKRFSDTWASSCNDWCCDCGTIQEKLHSKDACVQVSLGDQQSFKRINEYNLYDHQENINFEETEEVMHGTCKYCQKPLSASDFECEFTSIHDPLKLVEDFGNQYGGMNSIPKYAHTCCHNNPQNPYQGKFWDTSKVTEYLPSFQTSRPQLEHLCHEHYLSCIPRYPHSHQEVCSNDVCCSREIMSNPYHLQYNIKPFDRKEFTDNKCYFPHRSKAVLYNNFECSCSKSLENIDNRHRFAPICNLHRVPETSLSNECNNFHKIRKAKYYMEYSKVSDYRTPPQNNTFKHKALGKSRHNIQTPCEFNFCLDSQQAACWKSPPDCSSRCMLKRSEEIVTQLNCHKENSSGMVDNMHLLYTTEDTQKGYPKDLQSIDIKSPILVPNINPVITFRNTEEEILNNVASTNSLRSPTQSRQLQPLVSPRIQQDVPYTSGSNLSGEKNDENNVQLNRSSSHEQIIKEKSNVSIQRTSNVNVQQRYRNPEVMDDIYKNADNVLEEMKTVLIKKGKWNGK